MRLMTPDIFYQYGVTQLRGNYLRNTTEQPKAGHLFCVVISKI